MEEEYATGGAVTECVYKIVAAGDWHDSARTGVFEGSTVDRRDGFIHLSTSAQVRETAHRHFAGRNDLLLVTVDPALLDLRWERSRGGDLFPHLYGLLPHRSVISVVPLPIDADEGFSFPPLGPFSPVVVNEFGQRIGLPLPGWSAPPVPPRAPMQGRWVDLQPLHRLTAMELFNAFSAQGGERDWTYLPYGPFEDQAAFDAWIDQQAASLDPLLFSLHAGPGHTAQGLAGYLRIAPLSGSIEIGHLRFSKGLQRTVAATEALFLMMRQPFELGYRRLEWKCDAFNAPSRAAATRLGFQFEGTFRQATVYKGRSRDTAWYAVTDGDWPRLRQAFEEWLDPSNFDASGRQRRRLSEIRRERGIK
jgi:uncharacterized protein (DUF952 family)/RimJ/RimL family protein N-acetyltransferase